MVELCVGPRAFLKQGVALAIFRCSDYQSLAGKAQVVVKLRGPFSC